MKPCFLKAGRMLFLVVLAALVLMLTGSGDPHRPLPKPHDLENSAAELGRGLSPEDRAAWQQAAKINPLWLLEATVR